MRLSLATNLSHLACIRCALETVLLMPQPPAWTCIRCATDVAFMDTGLNIPNALCDVVRRLGSRSSSASRTLLIREFIPRNGSRILTGECFTLVPIRSGSGILVERSPTHTQISSRCLWDMFKDGSLAFVRLRTEELAVEEDRLMREKKIMLCSLM